MGIEISSLSIQGERKYQQDSLYTDTDTDRVIACICDGMGGMSSGEIASRFAVEKFVNDVWQNTNISDMNEFLKKEAICIDDAVFQLTDEKGKWLKCGSTIAAVYINEKNLYWMSVGDSKIYVIRKDRILCVTKEHNYRMQLDELLAKGQIDKAAYDKEATRADYLISYLGMGNVKLIDVNSRPFILSEGDKIVICSDGVYRNIVEKDILNIASKYEKNIKGATNEIMMNIKAMKNKNQDNASLIMILYN